MDFLNEWDKIKIIKKENIINYEFLMENDYIEEICDSYFCLKIPFYEVKNKYYQDENKRLREELCLNDSKKGLKDFIKKLNKYNEAKDVAESLMGKIADLKGMQIKEIHNEMGIN